jgi:hypothetical protein
MPGFRRIWSFFRPDRTVEDLQAVADANPEDDFAEQRVIDEERHEADRARYE